MPERKDLKKGEVRGFLQQRKIEYKIGSNNNLILMFCPYCKGGERRDKFTFAINEKTGAYICFRAKCGAKGHFYQLKNKKVILSISLDTFSTQNPKLLGNSLPEM